MTTTTLTTTMRTTTTDGTTNGTVSGQARSGTTRAARRGGVAAAGVVVTTALLLAGCSSNGGSSAGSHGAVSTAAGAAPAAQVAKAAGGASASSSAQSDIVTRQLARRADMSIIVSSVTSAAGRVEAIASSVDGYVVDEDVQTGPATPPNAVGAAGDNGSAPPKQGRISDGYATLTLSVPAAMLRETMTSLAKLGKVTDRTSTTSDVTGKVIDTASRLKTLRASVARVRTLMARATKISDVVAIESQLSDREAELEALESSSASLRTSVARSTVTVSLSTRATALVKAKGPGGFFAGLRTGWSSFVTFVAAMLTVLGVVLPYLLAAALVGAVALLVWRRRRTSAQATPAES